MLNESQLKTEIKCFWAFFSGDLKVTFFPLPRMFVQSKLFSNDLGGFEFLFVLSRCSSEVTEEIRLSFG